MRPLARVLSFVLAAVAAISALLFISSEGVSGDDRWFASVYVLVAAAIAIGAVEAARAGRRALSIGVVSVALAATLLGAMSATFFLLPFVLLAAVLVGVYATRPTVPETGPSLLAPRPR